MLCKEPFGFKARKRIEARKDQIILHLMKRSGDLPREEFTLDRKHQVPPADGKCHIYDLPPEIIHMVFSYLTLKEIHICLSVSRKFNECAKHRFRQETHILFCCKGESCTDSRCYCNVRIIGNDPHETIVYQRLQTVRSLYDNEEWDEIRWEKAFWDEMERIQDEDRKIIVHRILTRTNSMKSQRIMPASRFSQKHLRNFSNLKQIRLCDSSAVDIYEEDILFLAKINAHHLEEIILTEGRVPRTWFDITDVKFPVLKQFHWDNVTARSLRHLVKTAPHLKEIYVAEVKGKFDFTKLPSELNMIGVVDAKRPNHFMQIMDSNVSDKIQYLIMNSNQPTITFKDQTLPKLESLSFMVKVIDGIALMNLGKILSKSPLTHIEIMITDPDVDIEVFIYETFFTDIRGSIIDLGVNSMADPESLIAGLANAQKKTEFDIFPGLKQIRIDDCLLFDSSLVDLAEVKSLKRVSINGDDVSITEEGLVDYLIAAFSNPDGLDHFVWRFPSDNKRYLEEDFIKSLRKVASVSKTKVAVLIGTRRESSGDGWTNLSKCQVGISYYSITLLRYSYYQELDKIKKSGKEDTAYNFSLYDAPFSSINRILA